MKKKVEKRTEERDLDEDVANVTQHADHHRRQQAPQVPQPAPRALLLPRLASVNSLVTTLVELLQVVQVVGGH